MKNKIMDAVIDIGALEGIESVTNKSVAKKCNMSPSNIYHHFRDRYDMILKTALHVALEETNVMNQAYNPKDSHEVNFKRILMTMAKYYNKKENRNHVGFLIRAAAIPPYALLPNDVETISRMCRISHMLKEGVKTGDIRDLDNIAHIGYVPFCMYLYSVFISKKKLNYKKIQDIIDSLWCAVAP